MLANAFEDSGVSGADEGFVSASDESASTSIVASAGAALCFYSL